MWLKHLKRYFQRQNFQSPSSLSLAAEPQEQVSGVPPSQAFLATKNGTVNHDRDHSRSNPPLHLSQDQHIVGTSNINGGGREIKIASRAVDCVAASQESNEVEIDITSTVTDPHEALRSGDRARYEQDWDTACRYYQQAIYLDSQWSMAHERLATALEQKGQFAEATEHYRQALNC
ncbi:MAG: hypothetical protein F6K09_20225 [Merismopedia sp. SIO2A8]|nr:hypothetical protein [Merismopedia sp. SIO2A8]